MSERRHLFLPSPHTKLYSEFVGVNAIVRSVCDNLSDSSSGSGGIMYDYKLPISGKRYSTSTR